MDSKNMFKHQLMSGYISGIHSFSASFQVKKKMQHAEFPQHMQSMASVVDMMSVG